MFIYNITFSVEEGIEDDWREWMKNEHLPEILASGKFERHRMLRLIDVQADTGITYAIQFEAKSLKDIQAYLAKDAPVLQKKTHDRYQNRLLAFRTVLEDV